MTMNENTQRMLCEQYGVMSKAAWQNSTLADYCQRIYKIPLADIPEDFLDIINAAFRLETYQDYLWSVGVCLSDGLVI